MNLAGMVEPIVALARAAGDAILEVYATDFEVQAKADDSPLTQADMAVIDNHKPILGIVHVPVKEKTYTGCKGVGATVRNNDAEPQAISVASSTGNAVRVVGSRSHRGASLDAYLEKLGEVEMLPMGSSLKFCVVAEGGADIYPRLGLTSEWDTAAAQAVVEQAGGAVLELDGRPLAYNAKADILNPHFMVRGPDDRDWLGMLPDDA